MHSPDESARVSRRLEYEYHRHNDKLRSDNAGRDVVPEWVQKKPVAAFWLWMFICRVPDSIVRLSGGLYTDHDTSNLYARLFATEAAPANHQARIRVTRKWLQELIRLTGTENVSDFLYVVHFLWSYAEKVNPMAWLGSRRIHIQWAWAYLQKHCTEEERYCPDTSTFKASDESRLFIIAYARNVFMNINSVSIEPQKLKELVHRQNDFLRRMKCSYQKMFRYEKTDSRVQISALISPEARNALRKMAKKNNLTQAEILDELILSADRLFMQKTAGDYSR
ncbi:replication regulatory RepB family protein [Escherichia coli]|nr:replication regulatory RepB family protein [Escherichia coli]MCA8826952.1 replication regulatory RepB family protein [Escherichia coli]